MSYATKTQVSEDRSRTEIERILMRYGADEFGYMNRRSEALIVFVYKSIKVQMTVPLPARDDPKFTTTPTGRPVRSETQRFNAWNMEVRRRWRSLCLVIKALLVGVDDGVLSFEQAFMPYMVLGDDGLTLYQKALPKLTRAIESGKMPNTLNQLEAIPVKK